MQITGYVNIDSIQYIVYKSDVLFQKEGYEKAVGLIDNGNNRIIIRNGMDTRANLRTLLHEVAHVWSNTKFGGKFTEKDCELLGASIYDLIYNNKMIMDLFDMVRKEDKKMKDEIDKLPRQTQSIREMFGIDTQENDDEHNGD